MPILSGNTSVLNVALYECYADIDDYNIRLQTDRNKMIILKNSCNTIISDKLWTQRIRKQAVTFNDLWLSAHI